ncbi:unnamed protein product, partial [Musa acuminata subsp. burmannicoides]
FYCSWNQRTDFDCVSTFAIKRKKIPIFLVAEEVIADVAGLLLFHQVQQLSEGGLIVPVEGIGHTQELVNPHGSGIGGIVDDRRRERRRKRILKP